MKQRNRSSTSSTKSPKYERNTTMNNPRATDSHSSSEDDHDEHDGNDDNGAETKITRNKSLKRAPEYDYRTERRGQDRQRKSRDSPSLSLRRSNRRSSTPNDSEKLSEDEEYRAEHRGRQKPSRESPSLSLRRSNRRRSTSNDSEKVPEDEYHTEHRGHQRKPRDSPVSSSSRKSNRHSSTSNDSENVPEDEYHTEHRGHQRKSRDSPASLSSRKSNRHRSTLSDGHRHHNHHRDDMSRTVTNNQDIDDPIINNLYPNDDDASYAKQQPEVSTMSEFQSALLHRELQWKESELARVMRERDQVLSRMEQLEKDIIRLEGGEGYSMR